jgi:TM2 domain-containing membrane protein YozV
VHSATANAKFTADKNATHATFGTFFGFSNKHAQREIHFQAPAASDTRNKLLLAVIELLGLGFFGVDRCYMGQNLVGLIKALTFGGLGVWALVDYIVIIAGCLARTPSLTAMGYVTTFSPPGDTEKAFWVTLAVMVIIACGALYKYLIRVLNPKLSAPVVGTPI